MTFCSFGFAIRKPRISAFAMRKAKERACQSARPSSFLYCVQSHCRQFPPNGMNRIENQGHSAFAGGFLATDILRHQTLGDAHATRQRRHIQFRMRHKELVKRCGLWLVKEALETQVFVQLLPMDSEVICCIVDKLLFCGITQKGIVRKKFAGFFAFIGSDPYGCIRQPDFLYFHFLSISEK